MAVPTLCPCETNSRTAPLLGLERLGGFARGQTADRPVMATAAFVSLLVAICSTAMLMLSRMGRTRPIDDDIDVLDVAPLVDRSGPRTPAPNIPGAPYRGAVNLVALLAQDESRSKVEEVVGGVDLAHFGAHLVEVIHSSGTAHLFVGFGSLPESGVVIVDGRGLVRSRLSGHEVQARTLRSMLRDVARDQAGRAR